MRICLISAEHSPWGGIGHSERRLATRHEVTLVRSDAGMAGNPRLAETGVREVVAEASAAARNRTFASEELQREVTRLRSGTPGILRRARARILRT